MVFFIAFCFKSISICKSLYSKSFMFTIKLTLSLSVKCYNFVCDLFSFKTLLKSVIFSRCIIKVPFYFYVACIGMKKLKLSLVNVA